MSKEPQQTTLEQISDLLDKELLRRLKETPEDITGVEINSIIKRLKDAGVSAPLTDDNSFGQIAEQLRADGLRLGPVPPMSEDDDAATTA